jgi:hypothetical protein
MLLAVFLLMRNRFCTATNRTKSHPSALSGPLAALRLALSASGGGVDESDVLGLQQLFVQLHRKLHSERALPFDLVFGKTRGQPSNGRWFMHHVFMPRMVQLDTVTGPRCLEWGRDLISEFLPAKCTQSHSLELDYAKCGGSPGAMLNELGFCADIHDGLPMIDSGFFDL